MIEWTFREKILYQKKTVTSDSRKFEILIETYLKERYPLENWKLTKATRDGNRDLENVCEFTGMSMWAEAKYTIHTEENIGSRKYDSTLVSSLLENNLIKIFFITNTSIGSNLIGRIRKFYYFSAIKQISFIDGYALSYWVKKHPDVERRFFKEPISFTEPSAPNVTLQCIRLICKSDSYTIDNVWEDQELYPLYLSKCYTIEGEFIAVGFGDKPLTLYCNDHLLYQGDALPEIMSFSLDIAQTGERFRVDEEYPLHIYYILDDKRNDCRKYSLKFAVLGELYQNQVQSYITIETGIKSNYKKIYNLYGPQSSGKSWILNNLKNDLLKNAQENRHIIYVNFNGQESDIADICRIIFTLAFDYYNLSMSAKALSNYCKKNNAKNSFFSPNNIQAIIQALQGEDYLLVKNILMGSVFSNTKSLFQINQSFAYEKTYFLDNIHLLDSDNCCILEAVFRAFDPLQKISFVLTSRNQMNIPHIENIFLDYIDNTEILRAINEALPFCIDELNEIVPPNHYLKYPGLLYSFLRDVRGDRTIQDVKNYYIDDFQTSALQYIRGSFAFESMILILVCFVQKGIPVYFLEEINEADLNRIYDRQFIIIKNDYVFPNYEKWDREMPASILNQHKKALTGYIHKFMDMDPGRREIYQCSLMSHYSEYYCQYFESVFQSIELKFRENQYSQVVFLCEALMEGKSFYVKENEKSNYIKYYLAFSYMHCDASKNAQKIFREITDSYHAKAKTALYFNAASEKIDAVYWGFKSFQSLLKEINNFRKDWMELKSEIIHLPYRAYLTAANRMMVTYLALDHVKLAGEWLRKNLKSAVRFRSCEHIGYSFMDYAKGIYHMNLFLALQYLQIADSYFQTASEKRRHFDCLCEIQYVKCLIGKGSTQQLLLAQEKLFENQYWIQYYKCHLKLAVCYILKGQFAEAKKYLLEAEASPIMKNDERIQYLCSMIESFLYKVPMSYKNSELSGTSYQTIIDNSQCPRIKQKAVLYCMYQDKNSNACFYLDPRVW